MGHETQRFNSDLEKWVQAALNEPDQNLKKLLWKQNILVQSFYGKKSVNLPLIATEGFSTVLDSAMYPY